MANNGFKFQFDDKIIPKYKEICSFSEGYAAVLGQNGLWGFIDKQGNEVISCQYKKVESFSCGLALVSNDQGVYGYIDVTGKLVIPFQFEEAFSFKEDLAVAKNTETGKYGFINKKGEFVIEAKYGRASDFKNGLSVVVDPSYSTLSVDNIDKKGNKVTFHCFDRLCYFSRINNNIALIKCSGCIYFKDAVGELKSPIIDVGRDAVISFESCGFYRVYNPNTHKHNFLRYEDVKDKNKNNTLKLDYPFNDANDYRDDVAVIKYQDIVGFRSDTGFVYLFPQFSKLDDFSQGLSAAQDKETGLFGYFSKETKELAIPCKYLKAGQFGENLAGVLVDTGHIHFINQKDRIKFTLSPSYQSTLKTNFGEYEIEADTLEELGVKKAQLLAKLQDEYTKNMQTAINSATEVSPQKKLVY